MHKTFLLFLALLGFSCADSQIQTGADQVSSWLPFLRDKSVGLVVNQTSRVGEQHLADTLLSLGIKVQALFAPEHGIRGDHGAGEKVKSGKDIKTGLPIISLYGSHKKPTKEDLKDMGLVVFDIQDVGARFYTYISTLHYVMEACAEQGIPVIVLDRPNPNGHYVDGPVLDTQFRSFVGMHPIPVVHGMTIGEYASMINGEGWLKGGIQCELHVVKLKGYTHKTPYHLPVAPSPNLPNDLSIQLYPSLCFFEGTQVSVGRGTATPFQIIGSPYLSGEFWDTSFRPISIPHAAPNPPFLNTDCRGKSYLYLNSPEFRMTKLDLDPLIKAHASHSSRIDFFNDFFDKLAGSEELRHQIRNMDSEETIRASWQPGLEAYKQMRRKYLLYEDFE
ncbi:MAG: DUF1343 domain-containing protein [Bacteroidota bacterium]|nr:DUF1343 domain-containing protein [Bacteroidota bacterium]MDX5431780.1 DUF1343 domain-containing protein [Bacteroidota bacterium]MDX5470493.1 DUF1343 domain-containing protein [Bacteroidota bacterium]